MIKVKNQSGLYETRLNESEQEIIWNDVCKNVCPIGQHSLFTPQDNLEYFIINEIELKYNSYKATIKANNKIFSVSYNICNQDLVINKAVRKAYN